MDQEEGNLEEGGPLDKLLNVVAAVPREPTYTHTDVRRRDEADSGLARKRATVKAWTRVRECAAPLVHWFVRGCTSAGLLRPWPDPRPDPRPVKGQMRGVGPYRRTPRSLSMYEMADRQIAVLA